MQRADQLKLAYRFCSYLKQNCVFREVCMLLERLSSKPPLFTSVRRSPDPEIDRPTLNAVGCSQGATYVWHTDLGTTEYFVDVKRPAAAAALTLTQLTVVPGSLSPTFTSGTHLYSVDEVDYHTRTGGVGWHFKFIPRIITPRQRRAWSFFDRRRLTLFAPCGSGDHDQAWRCRLICHSLQERWVANY
eukprot:SAG11_NODE_8403_length_1019_cov_2.038043_2_plen_188_part_00